MGAWWRRRNDDDVLMLQFESLVDPLKRRAEIVKFAEFAGVKADDALIDHVVKETSFER